MDTDSPARPTLFVYKLQTPYIHKILSQEDSVHLQTVHLLNNFPCHIAVTAAPSFLIRRHFAVNAAPRLSVHPGKKRLPLGTQLPALIPVLHPESRQTASHLILAIPRPMPRTAFIFSRRNPHHRHLMAKHSLFMPMLAPNKALTLGISHRRLPSHTTPF